MGWRAGVHGTGQQLVWGTRGDWRKEKHLNLTRTFLFIITFATLPPSWGRHSREYAQSIFANPGLRPAQGSHSKWVSGTAGPDSWARHFHNMEGVEKLRQRKYSSLIWSFSWGNYDQASPCIATQLPIWRSYYHSRSGLRGMLPWEMDSLLSSSELPVTYLEKPVWGWVFPSASHRWHSRAFPGTSQYP